MLLFLPTNKVILYSMADKFNKKYFGKRLKEIRKAKGLTQEAVCDLASIDVSNYSKMETGKVMPSMPSLYKIIKNAHFVPNEIFDCEHLVDEIELDSMVLNEYNKLSLKEKRIIYRQIQILKEYNS